MSDFDDFLAEQEKLDKEATEQKKESELRQKQLKQGASESWEQIQGFITMLTNGRHISGVTFEWRPKSDLPAMLLLNNLAAVFNHLSDEDQYSVTFGHIPGNEMLWVTPRPDLEIQSLEYHGVGTWSVLDGSNSIALPINSEGAAQIIAERFTAYFLNFRQSRER
jgi:hypothetical protein